MANVPYNSVDNAMQPIILELMASLITLTTDFGLTDGFVGVMRGVIYSIAPDAPVIDLSHGIPPQQVYTGARLLAASVPYFPPQTVHLCVVDPGVGSARQVIAITVGETILVGPDNGVLSLAVAQLERSRAMPARAVKLDQPRYWLPRVSNTFHGRDIFAPAAAHLAQGVPLGAMGTPLDRWITLDLAEPTRRADGALVGEVVYVDRFGNLLTNLSNEHLAEFGTYDLQIEIGGEIVRSLARAYADVAPGELVALLSSSWQLEIAVRDGNAAEQLGVTIGGQVILHPLR